MKKSSIVLFSILITTSCLSFSAALNSLSKDQIQQAFVNKTITSIPTSNLNEQVIPNTISVFLDAQGNIMGKFLHKPANEPQTDKGVYTINNDGALYITWQHWDNAKKLCVHVYNTKNSYIIVNCNNVFHTGFIKDTAKPGNHLMN